MTTLKDVAFTIYGESLVVSMLYSDGRMIDHFIPVTSYRKHSLLWDFLGKGILQIGYGEEKLLAIPLKGWNVVQAWECANTLTKVMRR